MIKPKLNTNPLILSPGHFYEQYWDNVEAATQNVLNWEYNCIYQLKPNGLNGQRQVLDLNSMQINHVSRAGGMMLTPSASKDSSSKILRSFSFMAPPKEYLCGA